MKIDELKKAIMDMVESSGGGILSVGVYSGDDDFIITGYNGDNMISSVSNDLFKAFSNNLRMFNFAKSLNNYAVVFDDRVYYTGKLSDEFNFTVVIDTSKLQFGFFKTVLLKRFLNSINNLI